MTRRGFFAPALGVEPRPDAAPGERFAAVDGEGRGGVDPADAAIGARLKRWRDQRGVTSEMLARDLGVTPEALRRMGVEVIEMDTDLDLRPARHIALSKMLFELRSAKSRPL